MGHLTEVSPHESALSTTVYGSHYASQPLPRNEMPEDEMPARTAARFLQDELLMDGNPSLNLASFVTTYMEPEILEIMQENLTKVHFIDVEEYPACGEIESRCVNMIANLFNAPKSKGDPNSHEQGAMGVSTVGSSEAIILAVLAAKRRWQNLRKKAGKSVEKPNIVMNAAVQVCWEKAARYLEVEEKYWFCTEEKFVLDPKEAVDLVDENTILVVAILGTTYTGQYEDAKTLNDLLEEKNKKDGLDVGIHIDAASGGFVVPFVDPERLWDFRLPRVISINASGHKYGLVIAGVGWAIWRSKEYLPDEILFEVNYLGSPQISFTLNFSKSAVQVLGQYYQLIRFGKAGYSCIMNNITETADFLASAIANFPNKKFTILSEGGGQGLPLVAWRLTKKEHYDEFAIARTMRLRGIILPAYTMAPNAGTLKLLRVVVREDFSRSRCEGFIRDLHTAIEYLEHLPKQAVEAIDKAKDAALAVHNHVDIHEPEKHDPHEKEAHAKKHDKHRRNHRGHVRIEEKHSLQGKHGKTHAVC